MKKLNQNMRFAANGLWMIAFVAMLSSCASTKQASVDLDYVYKNGFMMAKPIVVDISVEKRKIDGKASIKNNLYGKEVATQAAKNLAVIDAVRKGDADILVQPLFEILSSNGYTTATVSGYAGKYKEFREATASDTTAFKLRQGFGTAVPDYVAPGEVSITKKSKAGIIIGGVVLVGALLALLLI
jgi:hypothetical protein